MTTLTQYINSKANPDGSVTLTPQEARELITRAAALADAELLDCNQALRADNERLRDHVASIVAAEIAVRDANYAINKARTDADDDAAMADLALAERRMETAIQDARVALEAPDA